MKKLATTLTALVIATGLTVSAQAATKVTTTTKSTTTHKNVATAKAKPQKATTQKSTKASKNKHSAKASATAKKGTKATKRTSEVNIDIPAELKIDESSNKSVAPAAPRNAQSNPRVVPVAKVTQTGPAVQSVTVQPVDNNTAIASTTTTVPVDVQTVPVVVNP